MKKLRTCPAILFLLTASASSLPVHAQFFKQLLNNVKQTAQNRANSKADQTTNKVLDKADSATKTGGSGGSKTGSSISSSGDTASTNRVLGAFAKAAAANPNDTSAGDLTMKALGLLVSGGGVSAADSAAAIRSFMTSSGGSGMFYQYITTTTMKQKTNKDTSFSYLTNDGDGRKEMRINMPGVMSNKIITIGHAGQPKYSILLDPDAQTYSLNIIDTSLINAGRENYRVTKVGSETVQGYPCIHVKLTSTSGSGMFRSTSTEDLWTSTAVPGYAAYKRLVSLSNVQPQMIKALESAGAGGFIIKMEAGGKDYSMSMLLMKAEEKNFPASLFRIPSGYTESKQNMMYHMLSGVKK